MQIPSSDSTIIANATKTYDGIMKLVEGEDRAWAITNAQSTVARGASVARLGAALALVELTGESVDLTWPARSDEKIITAQFDGICIACAQATTAGAKVLFGTRSRQVHHVTCPIIAAE